MILRNKEGVESTLFASICCNQTFPSRHQVSADFGSFGEKSPGENKSRWPQKGTPLNKDNNSKSIDLRSNKSVKNAASAQEMKVCPRKRSSRGEDWNISGNIFNWRHYLRNSTLIYNPHLQYDCNSSPGVFKTLLNNSKARRNFRYANLFLTVISSYAAKYFPIYFSKIFFQDFRHVWFWKVWWSLIMCVSV